MTKVLICGATGYGNIGDDCIRDVLADSLKDDNKLEVKTTRPFPQIQLIEWSDVVVLGGGGILYDGNGIPHGQANFNYYVANYLEWALNRRKKVGIVAVGVQSFKKQQNINLFRRLAGGVETITVRQQQDAQWFQDNRIKCKREVLVGDDVGMLTPCVPYNFTAPSSKPKLAIVPHFMMTRVYDMQWLIQVLRPYYDLYVACTSYEDMGIVKQLSRLIGKEGSVRDFFYMGASQIASLLGEMDVVVSNRFHGLVLAKAGGCQNLFGVGTNGKIRQQVDDQHHLHSFVRSKNQQGLLAALKNKGELLSHGSPNIHVEELKRLIYEY